MVNFFFMLIFLQAFVLFYSSGDTVRFKRYCNTCGCCPAKYQLTEYKYENPCSNGQPILNRMKLPAFCSWHMEGSCPTQYWCHVGATTFTTTCCPLPSGIVNPCELFMEPGEGYSKLPRWYFDTNSRTCQPFAYNGLKGNNNNFLTKFHCESACLINQPCRLTVSTRQPTGYCTDTVNSCNRDFYCHYGPNPGTTLCCPRASGLSPCQSPLSVGEGYCQLLRYYYDQITNLCNSFIYLGFRGNENNFLTKETCESVCSVNRRSNPCPVGDWIFNCSKLNPCPVAHWCHFGLSEDNVCCPLIQDKNICEMPSNAGQGQHSLKRWYYDVKDEDCREFVYHGTKGNANNFLSKSDCRDACTKWINPCGFGKPLVTSEGKTQSCSGFGLDCPSGYWCHAGPDDYSSVCCQRIGDTCNLPLSNGVGALALPRWYYDVQSRKCKQFIYSGSKGNENNFPTREQCQVECEELENPCPDGEPAEDKFTRQSLTCGEKLGCPEGYFCHVGPVSGREACCRTKEIVCRSPLSIGRGNATLMRWYFDVHAKNCSLFWYKGYKGNGNNFLSQEQCTKQCPGNQILCTDGQQPYIDPDSNKVALCHTGQKRCPQMYFCNLGYDDSTTVCCPKRGDVCLQPMLPGDGPGNLSRWYYNTTTEECRQFKYLGVGGNENNFLTEIECNQNCRKTSMKQYCPHGEPLLDKTKLPKTCNFDSNCPQYFVCHVNTAMSISVCCPEPERFCLLPKDPGSCTESKSRYGYEPASDTCVPFQFGGCGGNLNNFESLEVCTEICCSRIGNERKYYH